MLPPARSQWASSTFPLLVRITQAKYRNLGDKATAGVRRRQCGDDIELFRRAIEAKGMSPLIREGVRRRRGSCGDSKWRAIPPEVAFLPDQAKSTCNVRRHHIKLGN